MPTTKLAPEDPRHGTNGYTNYDCRCQVCRDAWAEYHHTVYSKIEVGGYQVDVPKDFHIRLKAYSKEKGISMRQIAMHAIWQYMEQHP